MAKTKNPLAIASKAIDPTLNALFASSSGPVTAPPKSRYSGQQEKKSSSRSAGQAEDAQDAEEEDDEVLSEISEELDYGDDDGEDASGTLEGSGDDEGEGEDEDNTSAPRGTKSKEEAGDAVAEAAAAIVESGKTKKDRKRKRKDDNEGLEGKYLAELTRHEEAEPLGKRQKGEEEDSEEGDDDNDDEKPPVHEALTQDSKKSEIEKAARTVFLANVSSEVISSKTAKKTLMKHLASVLHKDASPPEKIESIRFRSLAFATGAMPKRAAYITKSVMEATTKSANAYAVFSTTAAARKVVAQLNGTEVLDRHLRVDSVAHPTPTDHRRCVFVGNLGFVDDETVLNTNVDGETVEKKRTKVPADVEEGLWRTFGKQGRVENVRVVRDSKTRVGKGFAYVQFYEGNDVEAALLLDGKKFPPMLPRALRVTRAKDPRKTAQAMEKARAKAEAADSRASGASGSGRNKYEYRPKATPEEQAAAGRASKLLGRSGAAHMKRGRRGEVGAAAAAREGGAHAGGGSGSFKTPHDIIFEGRRASARDGLPKDLKLGKKGKSKGSKPKGRGARRAAAWKSKS